MSNCPDRCRAGRHRALLRPRRLRTGRRCDGSDADCPGPSVGAQHARCAHDDGAGDAGGDVMALLLAAAIGILASSGVWLLLRPRTYQVIIGLSLCSYAVNLFIFSMGRLRSGAPPILVVTGRQPGGIRRSGAAGAGPDGDRHRLRDDRTAAGRAAGVPRSHAGPIMSTARSGHDGLGTPPDHRAHHAAARGRRPAGGLRRATAVPERR